MKRPASTYRRLYSIYASNGLLGVYIRPVLASLIINTSNLITIKSYLSQPGIDKLVIDITSDTHYSVIFLTQPILPGDVLIVTQKHSKDYISIFKSVSWLRIFCIVILMIILYTNLKIINV